MLIHMWLVSKFLSSSICKCDILTLMFFSLQDMMQNRMTSLNLDLAVT